MRKLPSPACAGSARPSRHASPAASRLRWRGRALPRDRVTRYEASILPLAIEAEQQAQAAYNGGQISLPLLLQLLVTARDTRHRGLQAGLDYQNALTELDRAIGASVK